VMDVAADGALLAEFRMAPLLLEPHGLAFEAAVEAMVEGLQRGTRDSGVPAGLIVCAMRHEPSERVRRAAELAARYAQHGVIGFDLAGAEKGFPATAHASAIAHAREAGLGITLHAGEADDGERVIEAIELGATRIGHGVRIAWGEGADERMAQAREAGVHFEVCLTSNLHTGACTRIEEHPLPRMLAAGLSASIQTDNRLMSLTTGSQEYVLALGLNLSREQIMQGAREAAGASFLPAAVRERVAARL
jgi:adenosine deaminase